MAKDKTLAPSRYLTSDTSDTVRARTYAGMAHFAGTGPRDKVCWSCQHFDGPIRIAARKMDKDPHRCKKHRALTGRWGGDIPYDTPSCRHYEMMKDPGS